MDANGTRYHLLLGQPDWARCTLDAQGRRTLGELWRTESHDGEGGGLRWNPETGELTLAPLAFQFAAAPRDVAPVVTDRRGAGRDAHGNWYWIAETGQEILVRSSGSERTTHFWSAQDDLVCVPEPRYGAFGPVVPPSAPVALDLSGLAVTEDQFLVVGVLAPAGLLIFDLFEGGAPRQLTFPAGVPFAPFDLAARPGGGVWALDRQHRRYWAFDRRFDVVPCGQPSLTLQLGRTEDFQPLEPADGRRERGPIVIPSGISLGAAAPLALKDPVSIEGLPDGSVLILDCDETIPFSLVHHLHFGQQVSPPLPTSDMTEHLKPGTAGPRLLRGHDIAFVPRTPVADGDRMLVGQLYVASAEGNQALAFAVSEAEGRLTVDALPVYLPMRLFGGKALIQAGGRVYYDFADRWLPLIEQRRPRFVDQATLYTPIAPGQPVFDGRDPDCVWHRLFLDACLSAGAELSVRSRAANDLNALQRVPWRDEPRPYPRQEGSELPYVRREDGYATWELLFQRARGRYLQIELTLRGNGQTSPRLRALRAYYGRFSYLTHYLPAVYRENEASASFLDRFLANVEGMFTALEDRVAASQVLLDPRTAPEEALDWLVGWFGVALDAQWEEARRRLFIRHAASFLRQRGTLNGLHMALQLAFDACPDERLFTTPLAQREALSGIRIVERYRTRQTPGVVFGDPTEAAGLRLFSPEARWRPDDGAAQLQQRYTQFIEEHGLAGTLPPVFSPAPLADATAWQQFAREALGFIPSADAADSGRWQSFLRRRYRNIDALNDRYRLTSTARYTGFAAVPLPAALPPDGAALLDWYQFHAVALPTQRNAHRFIVLLPMPRTAYIDAAAQDERLVLARRVIELEKPTHTTFDVRFYWAMFRVGEARLGYDTLIELGSRSAQFMSSMVLGQGHLVEGYLSSAHPAPQGRWYLAGDRR